MKKIMSIPVLQPHTGMCVSVALHSFQKLQLQLLVLLKLGIIKLQLLNNLPYCPAKVVVPKKCTTGWKTLLFGF
jgi:hypothetical protein